MSDEPWLRVATAPDCPFAGTLFLSLLNAGVTYDPVGWGVPYASALVTVRACVRGERAGTRRSDK